MRGRFTWIFLSFLLVVTALPAFSEDNPEARLDEIRARLRAEAGATEQVAADGEDIPMVAFTVLPGDDHRLLALDLTGSLDTKKILLAVEPHLTPGMEIMVPRALLLPGLSDDSIVTFEIGRSYNSLWKLAQSELEAGPGEAAKLARNLQRLNHIADISSITPGTLISVPRALLKNPRLEAPTLAVSTAYRTRNLKGLARTASAVDIPFSVAKVLRKKGQWKLQQTKPPLDLVVVHTTEHNAGSLEAVGQYLQRNRLANYLVGPKGEIFEIVPPSHRAYGCGESLWDGRYAVDHQAINIEVYANTAPGERYTGIAPEQYAGLRDLLSLIRSKNPKIHAGRVVTHRMVALSYKYNTRSRKGDPYEFDWTAAGLPDNSLRIDQDVLLGRAGVCQDKRYADRITEGQTAAAIMLHQL